MKRNVLMTIVLMAAVAVPVGAAENGFYVGGGLGVSSLDVRDFNPDYADLRFEQEDFGFKLFGGYRVLKYFAVEAGYTDFGNVKMWEGGNLDSYQESNIDVTMWSGYAVGLIPVSEKVDLFGKVGYASWNVDNRVIDVDETEDRSTSGSDPAWGLGINLRFKKLGARFEGDWLNIGDSSGVFLFSVSLTYQF